MTRNRSNGIFQPGFLFSSNGGLPVNGIFPEESIGYGKYVVRRNSSLIQLKVREEEERTIMNYIAGWTESLRVTVQPIGHVRVTRHA